MHFRDKKPHFVNYCLFSGLLIFILAVTFAETVSSNGETNTNMSRKNTIRLVIVSAILAGAFLILSSASSTPKDRSCKESIDECCKKKNAGESDKATWKNLSQQFFSSI
jgi:hypothetical protein